MTAPHIVDPYELLTKALGDASPDLLRTLLQSTINMLLSADADAVVGAEYGVPSADRVSDLPPVLGPVASRAVTGF